MFKKLIKTTLKELPLWNSYNFEELQQLKKKHNKQYTTFTIESIPNHCGCYYNCRYPNEILAFVGSRLETDEECQIRRNGETEKQKQQQQEQERIDREVLKRLQAKYPDWP